MTNAKSKVYNSAMLQYICNIAELWFGPVGYVAGDDGLLVAVFLPESEPGSNAPSYQVRRIMEAFPGVREDKGLLPEFAAELAGYSAGRVREFSVRVDLSGLPDFSRRVLERTRRIPFGETLTYGQLAAECGNVKACRAVGMVMARNPLPLVIPCHRVLAGDGSLGGFSGGLDLKRKLLAHEAAVREG